MIGRQVLTFHVIVFSNDLPNHDLDIFEITPLMSTFSFGFVMSELTEVKYNGTTPLNAVKPVIKVWGRPDFHDDLIVRFFSP